MPIRVRQNFPKNSEVSKKGGYRFRYPPSDTPTPIPLYGNISGLSIIGLISQIRLNIGYFQEELKQRMVGLPTPVIVRIPVLNGSSPRIISLAEDGDTLAQIGCLRTWLKVN